MVAQTKSNTVYVQLLGGLGNQLFQYAMGRTLADQRGVDLVLDHRMVVEKGFISGLAIELFNIRADYINDDTASKYSKWKWKLSRGLRRRIRPLLGFYHETEFTYDNQVAEQKPTTVLSGFWQSYKYIKVSQQLLSDLTLKSPYTEHQQTFVDQMASANSVAMHVRRGDYIRDPKTLAKHGVCSGDYYRQAVAEIERRVKNPVYFVFSDDPDWVRENVHLENVVFVSDEGFDQEIDLTLISKCKHQIIANSSFSWWGAFLNSNPEKVVVVPSPWFELDSLPDTNMSPENWIRVKK